MKQFCKFGHDTFVCGRAKTRNCKKCHNIDNSIQWKKNPEKSLAKFRKYYKKALYGFKERQWKRFGIKNIDLSWFKEANYQELYSRQSGACAVCARSSALFPKRLVVDHDHTTGIVRGLLCDRCNRTIVNVVEHQPDLVKIAQQYVGESYATKNHTLAI